MEKEARVNRYTYASTDPPFRCRIGQRWRNVETKDLYVIDFASMERLTLGYKITLFHLKSIEGPFREDDMWLESVDILLHFELDE